MAIVLVLPVVVPAVAGPIHLPVDDTHTAPSREEPSEIRRARQALRDDEPARALLLLREACRTHQELPPARLILAEWHLSSGETERGRAELERAAAEAPDEPAVYLAFGKLALAERRVTDARLHFDNAAALIAASKVSADQKRRLTVRAQTGLAAVGESREDWKAARTALAAWLDVEPRAAVARARLARAAFELGQVDEARRELVQAVADDPRRDPPGIALGWMYNNRGDLKQAEAEMRSAVREAPQSARAQLGWALWLVQQERFDEAKEAADAAAGVEPGLGQLATVRGLIARHLKEYDDAERHFRSVLIDNPADFIASNQLALVLAERQDETSRRRAMQLAEMNFRQYPQMAEARSTLGRVCDLLGRNDDAVRMLRSAVDTGQATADAGYYLARSLAQSGADDLVVTLLERALEAPLGQFSFRAEARRWLKELTSEGSVGKTDAISKSRSHP